MSMVGQFPGLNSPNRRTIRATPNPLDKSTVVSILQKEIQEYKHTIQQGTFHIDAGTFTNPAILVVGTSSWWREIDEQQPLLEIPVSSVQIADSIVRDYCNGIVGCDMSTQMPGLFYLPGEFTVEKIKRDHPGSLLKAQAVQKKWFLELVKMADILWARSNGNPLSISSDSRLACRELNITDKPWLKDHQTSELVRCIACGNLRNPAYPICAICKAIADPELAKKLNLTFAQ